MRFAVTTPRAQGLSTSLRTTTILTVTATEPLSPSTGKGPDVCVVTTDLALSSGFILFPS